MTEKELGSKWGLEFSVVLEEDWGDVMGGKGALNGVGELITEGGKGA